MVLGSLTLKLPSNFYRKENQSDMESKEKLISFGKGGNGGNSASLRIPPSWLEEIGVTPEARAVILSFEDDKIVITKDKNKNE